MGTPFIDNFCTQFRGQEKSELKFSTTVDLSMISVKDMYILCLDIYIYIYKYVCFTIDSFSDALPGMPDSWGISCWVCLMGFYKLFYILLLVVMWKSCGLSRGVPVLWIARNGSPSMCFPVRCLKYFWIFMDICTQVASYFDAVGVLQRIFVFLEGWQRSFSVKWQGFVRDVREYLSD